MLVNGPDRRPSPLRNVIRVKSRSGVLTMRKSQSHLVVAVDQPVEAEAAVWTRSRRDVDVAVEVTARNVVDLLRRIIIKAAAVAAGSDGIEIGIRIEGLFCNGQI